LDGECNEGVFAERQLSGHLGPVLESQIREEAITSLPLRSRLVEHKSGRAAFAWNRAEW
jgi:hypothetical protein